MTPLLIKEGNQADSGNIRVNHDIEERKRINSEDINHARDLSRVNY